MARTFGKLLCATWSDPDFLALSNDAKVLYLAFISQPDITPAGVVPITERRWKKWLGVDLEGVSKALDELSDGLFVVVDDDTAEVWIRSFIKHDQRLANSKLAMTVHSAVDEIRAKHLQNAAKAEVDAFGDKTPDERAIPENQEGPSDPHTDLTVLVPVPVVLVDTELEPGTANEKPEPAAANSEPANAHAAAAAAIEILCQHRIKRGGIDRPDGWRAKMVPTFFAEFGEKLNAALEANPDTPPEHLAYRVFGLTETDIYRATGRSMPPVNNHGVMMAWGVG